MRKARYDLRQVICKNARCFGYSSNVAKPGYWVSFTGSSGEKCSGRVLGRIAETDRDGKNCSGYLAVIRLTLECTHAGIAWVNPTDVTHCYRNPPADLFAWITGPEWVKNKRDIARIVAMNEHGTLSDSFIATRNDLEKAYNARPEYVSQWVLE